MAVSSGWTHTGLLKTAGVAPDAYSDGIIFEAEQGGMILSQDMSDPDNPVDTSIVDRVVIDPGEDLYLPKLGRESVTTYYAKTTTDGTTYSKSTDLQGNQIVFSAIDDAAIQLQEKFQYIAIAHAKPTWHKMSQSRRLSYLNGRMLMMGKALRRAREASVLSLAAPGLIPSANQINAAAPAHITSDDLSEIHKIMGVNYGSGEVVFGLVHPNEIPYLRAIFGYQQTGIPTGPNVFLTFADGQLVIRTHLDVYDDGVDGYHGMFWIPDAIGFASVSEMEIDDWYDGDTKSYKTSPDTDYAFGLQDNTRVVTIQTPQA